MAEIDDRALPPVRRGFPLQAFRLGQLVGAAMERAFEGLGVSPSDFAVISALGVLGRQPPSELAAFLRMPPTSLSTRLARLERDRLVRRVANPDDGRSHYVELTRAGRARLAAASPRFRALVDDVAERTERPIEEVTAAFDDLERALLAHLGRPVVPTGRRR